MKRVRTFKHMLFAALVASGCIEQYKLPPSIGSLDYLVVDSYLDPAAKTCRVALTRSQSLSEAGSPVNESGATVTLVDSHDNVVALKEISDGVYYGDTLSIDYSLQYRITIKTKSGDQYQSAWVTPTTAPPIDSVTWDISFDELRIKVNTHDPTGATKYYKWSFDETWQYQSAFPSYFVYQGDSIVERTEDVHTCWKSAASATIVNTSTIQFAEDVVSDFVVNSIPKGSEKLFIRYSINVKQIALSQDAFEYLNLLKNNTQNLGTPYDPLPSQVTGNYQGINTSKPALGFFFASEIQTKRIFIAFTQLPSSFEVFADYSNCQDFIVLTANLKGYAKTNNPVFPYTIGDTQLGYFLTTYNCSDCRLAGGVNVKPDFW